MWCDEAFAKDGRLRFPLLADFEPKGDVAGRYRAYRADEGVCERVLFVIDQKDVVSLSYLSPIAAIRTHTAFSTRWKSFHRGFVMSRFRTPVTSDDHIEGPLAAPPPPRSPYPPSLAGTAVRCQTPEVGARMRASRKLRFCAGAGAVMGSYRNQAGTGRAAKQIGAAWRLAAVVYCPAAIARERSIFQQGY